MSYESLERVLQMAYVQASTGKGHERHGDARPLGEQISFVIENTLRLIFLGRPLRKSLKVRGWTNRRRFVNCWARLIILP